MELVTTLILCVSGLSMLIGLVCAAAVIIDEQNDKGLDIEDYYQ